MAVYTDISEDDLKRFIAAYEAGELLSYKGIAEGVENSNFLLHTTKFPLILTLYVMFPVGQRMAEATNHMPPTAALSDTQQLFAYADSAMLAPIWSEIEADVLAHGIPVTWVREHLRVDGDLAGYLFQCVDCGKHRLHLDCA